MARPYCNGWPSLSSMEMVAQIRIKQETSCHLTPASKVSSHYTIDNAIMNIAEVEHNGFRRAYSLIFFFIFTYKKEHHIT